MPHYSYMVVEGPHDVEFVARLLRRHGFHRIQFMNVLDPFWHSIIPTRFPFQDDLLKRVPVPTFLQTHTHSIAIHSANGYTRIAETIQETLSSLGNPENVESIGIILDADSGGSIQERFTDMLRVLQEKNPALIFPNDPGQTSTANPRTGIYILPNNQDNGTLENLLLEAASINYPNLVEAASQYTRSIRFEQLAREDLDEYRKPAGANKALVGSIASILKPGKAIQVSIQDNRWFDGDAFTLPVIQNVTAFLNQLIAF